MHNKIAKIKLFMIASVDETVNHNSHRLQVLSLLSKNSLQFTIKNTH